MTEQLSKLLSFDEKVFAPHPLWGKKHDGILISAIAKHGWIENEDSFQRMISDPEIKWGFPFDKGDESKIDPTATSCRLEQKRRELRSSATRAAAFLNIQ